ncbi:hypothetical protein PG997_011883 [Apiospora hydei]|uniref:DUF2254 domain-containing protein n=1 Tax=Apiospora hydei TaxID=1337664 RepID=A0ABR1V490_9PEZI
MHSQPENSGTEWTPGLWRNVPWTALFSLVGFVLLCVGLAVILRTSDGREVETWPYHSQTIPVSVLLALTVSIANLCLSIALSKGYEISWWLKAVKGADLRRLQFDLDVQHHLSAITGRNTRLDSFAISAILSLAVSILSGPPDPEGF